MESKKTEVKELSLKEVDALIADKNIEVVQKAGDLSKQLGVKVHPLTFIVDSQASDFVIGYIREPSRLVKMRAMDKISVGQSSFAYQELLESCLIKEESDPRILSEQPEHDRFNLGASKFCGGLLVISTDLSDIKKN